MVYNLSLHYVQNIEDAQDITQEVFVKIHQNLSLYNPDKSGFKTWIYKITVNQSLDFIKAKKTTKRFGFIKSLFNIEDNDPNIDIAHFNHPGIQLEDKEQLQILFKHINNLPANQKTVLILSKVEGQSQKQVAAIMDLNIKAVESLLSRAKQNLLKKINQSEGF